MNAFFQQCLALSAAIWRQWSPSVCYISKGCMRHIGVQLLRNLVCLSYFCP